MPRNSHAAVTLSSARVGSVNRCAGRFMLFLFRENLCARRALCDFEYYSRKV